MINSDFLGGMTVPEAKEEVARRMERMGIGERRVAAPCRLAVTADEGRTVSYTGRFSLEGDRHRLLEGMLIVAAVIDGAATCVYVRDEYPGGRLPATFPQQEGDLPTAGDPEKYPGVAETQTYKEGVLVGYRWYDAKAITPAFPFGFGRSYTSFAHRDLRVTPAGDGSTGATVSVEAANTGAAQKSEWLSLGFWVAVSQGAANNCVLGQEPLESRPMQQVDVDANVAQL